MSASELRVIRLEPASAGGWWFAFSSEDPDTFAWALACVRSLPEQRRRWRQAERAWWIAAEALPALLIMLPGLDERLGDEEHDRAGARNERKRSRSRRRRTSQAGQASYAPPDVAEAFAELHLLPTAWPELVKSARRIAAQRHHPDHAGGEHARMVAANVAAEAALAWAERQYPAL